MQEVMEIWMLVILEKNSRDKRRSAQQHGQVGSEKLLPLSPSCMTVMDPARVPRSDRAGPFTAAQESAS